MLQSPHTPPPGFLAELAEQTQQIVFEYRPSAGQFTYLNPAFELIWLRTREEVFAHPAVLADMIHPDDRPYLQEAFGKVLGGEPAKDLEFRILLPNGTHRWLCLSAFPLRPAGGEPCIAGFGNDITAIKHHSDTLKKYAAKKNSVLEILSHDLAGPLNTIQGLSNVVRKRTSQYGDPQLDELVGLITEKAKRNVRLIREFVKQEFLESASVEVIKQRMNLVQKVQELIDQYKASELNIAKEFRLHCSADRIYAEFDEVKFMQVINNLFSNAIKFTHDGGIITTRIGEEDGYVVISVADNGVGIPEELQAGLFEKFTKARRPGLRGEESVGLGMSIIKTIVEWHQGEITFQSRENEGTTFVIRLPKGSL